MTEAEWLASGDLVAMVAGLEKVGSDRKLRLFTVAGCYLCRPDGREPNPKFECVVRFADGETDAEPVRGHWSGQPGDSWPEKPFVWAHAFAVDSQSGRTGYPPPGVLIPLLRCVFGNPFRPPHFAPEWRTDTAVTLARQMYAANDFSALPILADALQDAGCTNEELLAHCRDGTSGHVRGCWAVDVVLGKA
jgi:hypothetical protein